MNRLKPLLSLLIVGCAGLFDLFWKLRRSEDLKSSSMERGMGGSDLYRKERSREVEKSSSLLLYFSPSGKINSPAPLTLKQLLSLVERTRSLGYPTSNPKCEIRNLNVNDEGPTVSTSSFTFTFRNANCALLVDDELVGR